MEGHVEVHNVYRDCKEHAFKYKWIRSEEVGYDLGEAALADWGRQYWPKHSRLRWIEHIRGVRFWDKFDHKDFGLMVREILDDQQLLYEIVRQFESCRENLDVINWAMDQGINSDRVYRILLRLDINGKRLPYPIDPSL